MRTQTVELGARAYPIRVGAGLLTEIEAFAGLDRRVCVVTDRHVAALHLPKLLHTLNVQAEDVLTLDPGEERKNWSSAERIIDGLLARKFARDGVLVALGGGVVGDITGFVAAVYQRGVDFVQVPTTLLAQVDSAVGGKTGINHPRGKNMIGAFHQPLFVVADTATLGTLPLRELRAGLAEVIKYGMLADADFFCWLEQNIEQLLALDDAALTQAICHSCEIKAHIVAQDEREALAGGARALLNLGHTFGHAIETYTAYGALLHGEAVAIGLCMAAELSARLGWMTPDAAQRCVALIARAGLPVRPPRGMQADDFRHLMSLDKKVAGGQLRLVLMRGLGAAVLTADFDQAALFEMLVQFTSPVAVA